MFKVSCLVRDTKLPAVLRLLQHAQVYNVETLPVNEPQKANGSTGPRVTTKDRIDLSGRDRITAKELKELVANAGGSRKSYYYIVKQLRTEKKLRGPKGKGVHSYYEVTANG